MADRRIVSHIEGRDTHLQSIKVDSDLPVDFFVASHFTEWDQAAFNSTEGVRLFLNADTDNVDESDTARIVIAGDGGVVYGTIGHTGTFGLDADGLTFANVFSNELAIHNPATGGSVWLGSNGFANLQINGSDANPYINIFGKGSFDSGSVIWFGDQLCGVGEHIDDSIRLFGNRDVDIATLQGLIRLGSTNDLIDATPSTPTMVVDTFLERVIVTNNGSTSADTLLHLRASGKGQENGIKWTGAANNWNMFLSDGLEGAGDANDVVWGKTIQIVTGGNLRLKASGNIAVVKDLLVGDHGDPVSSASLEIKSDTKGFLPPRMTTSQRLSISSPVEGLQVYDNDFNKTMFFNGVYWEFMTQNSVEISPLTTGTHSPDERGHYHFDTSGGNIIFELPDTALFPKIRYNLKKIILSGSVSITTFGSQKIEFETDAIINNRSSLTIYNNGVDWFVE